VIAPEGVPAGVDYFGEWVLDLTRAIVVLVNYIRD
jgi:hypothetical protein